MQVKSDDLFVDPHLIEPHLIRPHLVGRLVKKFETVYIHQESWESPVGKRFRSLFSERNVQRVEQHPFSQQKAELSADQFSKSKRNIYITPHRGQFFKRCPGARPGLTCCNYFVLNLGQQCDLNCSYCYLQSFINDPLLTIYSNIDQALNELDQLGQQNKSHSFRIGTGEVIDSLSLDPLTLYSRQLIEFFRAYPNWRLEFKSKTHYVEQFLDVPHSNNVIVSWSINPQHIIEHEEFETSSLLQRLEAAQKCREKGFLIAFHIDPIIYHPEWKENYLSLVDQITSMFQPQDMPYISVGALRFQPEQRHMMRERFGLQSYVTSGELFSGKDGKLRYDKLLRSHMFQTIIERFKKNSSKWNVFLCMESPETWLQTTDTMPRRDEGLKELFDNQVIKAHAEVYLNK